MPSARAGDASVREPLNMGVLSSTCTTPIGVIHLWSISLRSSSNRNSSAIEDSSAAGFTTVVMGRQQSGLRISFGEAAPDLRRSVRN